MSFTQENRVNVGKCDGCEKQCEFGVRHTERCRRGTSIGSGHTCGATIEDMSPVLGGKPIDFYVNEAGNLIFAGFEIRNNVVEIGGQSRIATAEVREKLRQILLERALTISRLCDDYKKR